MKKIIKNISFLTALSGVVCLLSASLGTAYAGLSHRSVMQDIEGMHIVSYPNILWTDIDSTNKCTDVTFPTKVQGGPSADNVVKITMPSEEFKACMTTYQTTLKSPTGTHTAQCYVEAYQDPNTAVPMLKALGPGCDEKQDGNMLLLSYS